MLFSWASLIFLILNCFVIRKWRVETTLLFISFKLETELVEVTDPSISQFIMPLFKAILTKNIFFCRTMPFAFREQRTVRQKRVIYNPFTSSQKHFNEA